MECLSRSSVSICLNHEHAAGLVPRIGPEARAAGTAPGVISIPIDSSTQAVGATVLSGKVDLKYQIDGLGFQNSRSVKFPLVREHLREAVVVFERGKTNSRYHPCGEVS